MGFGAFIQKIENRINAKEPLKFFIKGFPFKALNPKRCGNICLPDGAEILGLITLNHIAEEISKIHQAEIIIFSDGFPYQVEMLEPAEDTIFAYHAALKAMLKDFPYLTFHDGLDCSIYKTPSGDPFPTAHLTPKQLKEVVSKMNAPYQEADQGLLAFFQADIEVILKAQNPGTSNSQISIQAKIDAKVLAKQFLKSQANFNAFLEMHLRDYNDLIHLSVHSYADFRKFPVSLVYPVQKRHTCPWQGIYDGEYGIKRFDGK
ncbi:MAG: L-tyrosine/L-tryptophan isonitrile synthase family protein [Alphaproteobacteria bacterium]|nr:L-tyrosine/L-tryptophan isonitrile synthase family protein [Alphaproteobacteria bacterium]